MGTTHSHASMRNRGEPTRRFVDLVDDLDQVADRLRQAINDGDFLRARLRAEVCADLADRILTSESGGFCHTRLSAQELATELRAGR